MLIPKKIFFKSLLLIISLSLFGCYPALKKEALSPAQSLVPVSFFYPSFHDDMDKGSLISAIKKNIKYLNKLSPQKSFSYGPHEFTAGQVRESQEAFLKLITENSDPDQLNTEIREDFLVYRAAGRVGNNRVLFTGYFEPIYEASLSRDTIYKYPIYKRPEDLTIVDLSLFKRKFKGQKIVGRIDEKRIVPYYSRSQIEVGEALKGRSLEIAWLKDPVDVAFLQIQGSGRLKLPDRSTISVGYSASNGLQYKSIGRYMLDKGFLTRKEMSMQAIRQYLIEHPEVIGKVLNYNPSYVFFRVLRSGPLGNISVPLTPGRSLALDYRLFPKGALAFISCLKPILNERGEIEKWVKFSRFVLNQDTGGAIRGAGRADIFWGSGTYAEAAAGHMKHDGELYILMKRPQGAN